MTYVETIHERTWDELIGGTAFPAMTANVIFAQATEAELLARGTLVAKDSTTGKYAPADSTVETAKVGTAILAYPITLSTDGEVGGTVYTSGVFNRERIILAHEGDTIDTHEEELRRLGIFLTSIQGVSDAEKKTVINGGSGTPVAQSAANGRSVYVTTEALSDNGSISVASVTAGSNIAENDTLIDKNGDVFSVTGRSGDTLTVGTKLYSIKGKDGSDGTPGKDGKDGTNGTPGKDGVGVTAITMTKGADGQIQSAQWTGTDAKQNDIAVNTAEA